MIIESAARLYRRASVIIVVYVMLGAALLVAIVGAELGYIVGSERGFALRLQAQLSLCQVQIERNTRPAVLGRAQPPPIPRGA